MNIFYRMHGLIFLTLCSGILFPVYAPVGSVEKKYRTNSEKKQLFKNVGCKYATVLDIQYPEFNKLKPAMLKQYQSDKISYDIYAKEYLKKIKAKVVAPMYLKWVSDVIGYGVFAVAPIEKGDFIGEYSGTLRTVKDTGDNLDYAWYYVIDGLNNQKLIIDGKKIGNELRFINHAFGPNTIRIDVLDENNIFRACYIASKDIAKDEELTVSYGYGYFSSRGLAVEPR